MSKRDNKGRFVKVTNDTEHRCSGKCTCKEAKKSMNEKKRFEKLRREGIFSVDGYEVPLNPGFLEKYLSALAAAYPENVHVSYDEDEEGEIEDDRHNVVICLGEDSFCDDPEAPKAVWDSGTEIIHIDPKNHKVWIEYPEEEEEENEEDAQTRENKDAYEHFRMLEEARDKIMKEREEREKARAKSSENPPEFLKIMSDFFDWCEKNGR